MTQLPPDRCLFCTSNQGGVRIKSIRTKFCSVNFQKQSLSYRGPGPFGGYASNLQGDPSNSSWRVHWLPTKLVCHRSFFFFSFTSPGNSFLPSSLRSSFPVLLPSFFPFVLLLVPSSFKFTHFLLWSFLPSFVDLSGLPSFYAGSRDCFCCALVTHFCQGPSFCLSSPSHLFLPFSF